MTCIILVSVFFFLGGGECGARVLASLELGFVLVDFVHPLFMYPTCP
ncbi:hypothetical protein POPTR_003G220866v4 [Populus trichocarpa]|jgi:hypothetical protein|uniref:Uncharacterized protein n=1 Tax=Populus trichocarpa TaxID=3694 RepID=A0ACC0TBD9_POPTR|nr:hypothetical protein BDE02_03G203000 [Populus trichocarpa]KAI9398738.1 hypothetical protein POPTR_003G220866v4 [Populus trichocarpa]